MNATSFARIALVCTAGLLAAAGAEAKGTLSVGLTIVSSCAVSSANVYRAASSNGAAAESGATMVAGCSNETSYTVTVSSANADAAARDEAGRQAQASRTQSDAGDVVVTLTY